MVWRYIAIVLCAVLVVAAPARADPSVLSFTYSTLSGFYVPDPVDPNAGTFTAYASASFGYQGLFHTSGTVFRLVEPVGFAEFDFHEPGIGAADFVLTLDLYNIDRNLNTASAAGSLVATDVDGDTIGSEAVSGTWQAIGSQATFTGFISELQFSDPYKTFDGQDGSFSMNFLEFPDMIGAVTDLTGIGDFFEDPFSEVSSLVTTQMIPAPGAALLGVFGLVLISRIKRRL